jgi:hypothetical protein
MVGESYCIHMNVCSRCWRTTMACSVTQSQSALIAPPRVACVGAFHTTELLSNDVQKWHDAIYLLVNGNKLGANEQRYPPTPEVYRHGSMIASSAFGTSVEVTVAGSLPPSVARNISAYAALADTLPWRLRSPRELAVLRCAQPSRTRSIRV